jgi:arginase
MSVDWDLELVVPLWQGGGDPDVARGAERLADLVGRHGDRRVVAPSMTATAPDEADSEVQDLEAVAAYLDAATALLDRLDPQRLVTLGGDCTVAVPSVSHLAGRYPELRLAWIDAHGDLNTPASSPSSHAHGMPLRALTGDGHARMVPRTTLSTGRVALFGTRALDDAEEKFIDEHQVAVLGSAELEDGVQDHVVQRLEAWLPEGAPLYLHLDLDVIDPDTWPAVAVPEPDGLSVQVLVDVVTALRARGDLVGASIAEYAPSRQHDPAVLVPVLRALGLITV